MLGFYNFSVVVTYIGLASAVFGMTQACNGNHKVAIVCLILCGVCDMFDGKIARAMKRSEDAQKFGIQIDSLCDLVCFGVFPAILGYSFGADGVFGNICLVVYVLGAVIRLAFFNVMEEKRQKETNECRTEYQGLPVTSAAVIFPLIFLLSENDKVSFCTIWEITMLFVSFLFILDFKVKKPDKAAICIFLILAIIVTGRILFLL
ncbi:MAG: CDP-alcohol phosphatidyltransferase family protein [Lachnospiraceae bacterium]|nr:CDP-alcohol phosphatidyltransferase family protein [Lachnospiraceae bacterium]